VTFCTLILNWSCCLILNKNKNVISGVTGEEPAGKDNIFYETVENEQFVTLHPGEFTVYFTNDIHRPNCTMDEPVNIHKAVVKIMPIPALLTY